MRSPPWRLMRSARPPAPLERLILPAASPPPILSAAGAGAEQAVVGPVEDHRLVVAAFALGDFVFVVREHEVEPAAVDVERFAEQLLAHRRALDVPARAAGAPGAVPRGLARLGRFPEREVGDVPLAFAGAAAFALQRFDRAVRELAVFGVFADVEVDVAIRFVGDAAVDEAVDEVDDLRHALGCAREVVDLVDAERREVRVVVGDVFLGDFEHRDAALVGFLDELVVDIGDVDDPVDFVAAVGEVALDAVEDHRPDHVADVGLVVDRRPAEVDADLARLRRWRTVLCACESVL